MNVPGSGLLGLALTVITAQPVQFYAATGRIKNAVGQYDTIYAPGVTILGSFQPVDVKLLQKFGLDMGKSHATFYANGVYSVPDRGESGDQFGYADRRWQSLGSVPWSAQDGWESVLLVDIGPDA